VLAGRSALAQQRPPNIGAALAAALGGNNSQTMIQPPTSDPFAPPAQFAIRPPSTGDGGLRCTGPQ
jgi:hypothetical protein